MLAIHIGPGPLALGLILPCLEQAGFEVCLVGRDDTDEPERVHYMLGPTDGTVDLTERCVAHACKASTTAQLPVAVQQRLGSGEPLLITCALGTKGKGAAAGAGLVSQILEQRPPDAETVVVLCENDRIPAYDALEQRDGQRVVVCRSVVDRVCTWHDDEHKRDELGRRAVRAHPVGEWIIGHPDPSSPLMAALLRADEVAVVAVTELAGYEDRKLWTVNGLHIVLALIARRTNLDAPGKRKDLLPLTARHAEFQEIASQVLPAIEAALAHRHDGMPRDDAYGLERVRVFCEAPDHIERVLSSLVRADLREFMVRFDRRICDAARAAHAAGRDVSVFRQIVAVTLQVLDDLRSYYPSKEHASQESPSAAIDELVVEAFEHALRGWLSDDERRARVERLRRLLEAQRDVLA